MCHVAASANRLDIDGIGDRYRIVRRHRRRATRSRRALPRRCRRSATSCHPGRDSRPTLVVQPPALDLKLLITTDPQGGRSVFTFTNLKENVGLTDNEFVFKIPRGVDVIPDAATK